MRIDLPAPPAGGDRPRPALPMTETDRVAIGFEAAFLAEMLRHTGLGRVAEAAGGSGDFSVFLLRAVADDIARTRPLGIGEAVAASLREGREP